MVGILLLSEERTSIRSEDIGRLLLPIYYWSSYYVFVVVLRIPRGQLRSIGLFGCVALPDLLEMDLFPVMGLHSTFFIQHFLVFLELRGSSLQ